MENTIGEVESGGEENAAICSHFDILLLKIATNGI